jgi:Tol biopolymer transport system component
MRLHGLAVPAALLLFASSGCGSATTVVTQIDLGSAGPDSASWSSDGSKIAFSGEAGELFVLDLRAHAVRDVGGGSEPDWSPDGKRLAWAFERAIYVGDAGGKRRTRVAEASVSTQSAEFPDWSPEGSRLAYSVSGGLEPDLVLVVDVRGGRPEVVAGGAISATATQPAWSPKGDELVFADDAGLVVVRTNGTRRRRLRPRVSAIQPAWSPDGRLIAFEENGAGISVMNARGGGLRRLTHSDFDASPTWSPDGRRIAFARYRPRGGIYVVAVRGGRAHEVTPRGG